MSRFGVTPEQPIRFKPIFSCLLNDSLLPCNPLPHTSSRSQEQAYVFLRTSPESSQCMQTPSHMCRHTSERPASSPTPVGIWQPLYIWVVPLPQSSQHPSSPNLFNLSLKNLRGLILLPRQSALLALQPNPYTRSASSFKVDVSTAFSQSNVKYRP